MPLLVGFVLIYILFKQIKRIESFKYFLDLLILKAPIVGHLVQRSIVAQIFRVLVTLEKSNLGLVYSIKLVAENTNNSYFKTALMDISQQVASGNTLHQSFSKYREFFPEYSIQMIYTGENTNQLSSMIEMIANLYESEVNDALSRFKVLIEPLTMLLLSSIVATVVIGIYLPIFSLGSVI